MMKDLEGILSQGKQHLEGFNAVKKDLFAQLGTLKNALPKELKKEIDERDGVKITKTLNDKRIVTLEFLTQEDADKHFDLT